MSLQKLVNVVLGLKEFSPIVFAKQVIPRTFQMFKIHLVHKIMELQSNHREDAIIKRLLQPVLVFVRMSLVRTQSQTALVDSRVYAKNVMIQMVIIALQHALQVMVVQLCHVIAHHVLILWFKMQLSKSVLTVLILTLILIIMNNFCLQLYFGN
ncbi:Hypothetical_protein [Hexamita inflata]|uniref:Hypothetical_protein n=1 Tax=Hexamita inflata TaxID=28002 RepID=A0AA86QEJ9_9EUKA|nr:Hypothetical protein HINF_LOCUS25354 [Hexamita inflata]CAI9957839.1 Hypothetical protein HINF_LOCUS45484 [Hexamita inflata]